MPSSVKGMSEEQELERAVFGEVTFEEGFKTPAEPVSLVNDVNFTAGDDENLFFVDEGTSREPLHQAESAEEVSDNEEVAWHDSDDERVQISLQSNPTIKKLRKSTKDDIIKGTEYTRRLRSRFNQMFPPPKWYSGNASGEEAGEELDSTSILEGSDPLAKILREKSSYVSNVKSKLLAPTTLELTPLADSAASNQNGKSILAISFHPSHPLLLSSGYDQLALISYIDGKKNPITASLHVRKSVYQRVEFHADGDLAILGSERKGLQFWNIQTGIVDSLKLRQSPQQSQLQFDKFRLSKDGQFLAVIGGNGWVEILSSATSQRLTGAKIESGEVADFAWIGKTHNLVIASTSGVIYEWNIEQRNFSTQWQDAGGSGVTRIALGGGPSGDRYIAIGTASGLVSIHDRLNLSVTVKVSSIEPAICEPRATLDQLVTPISTLRFSNDGQILVMASNKVMSAIRMVHVPSFTAFKNWPAPKTGLGHINDVAFSPGNELMAIAMEEGRIRLWRLEHYAQ